MAEAGKPMTVQEAIYARRAVRAYQGGALAHDVVTGLLDAAIQAPTAMLEEPWAFTVLQDPELLHALSESGRTGFPGALDVGQEALDRLHPLLTDPGFDLFYGAGTLIVIWAKPLSPFATADCWLAAENLMLAACAQGLGTCVIGLALGALATPEWKTRLGVAPDWIPVAPIIVGTPRGASPKVPRKPPEIAFWR